MTKEYRPGVSLSYIIKDGWERQLSPSQCAEDAEANGWPVAVEVVQQHFDKLEDRRKKVREETAARLADEMDCTSGDIEVIESSITMEPGKLYGISISGCITDITPPRSPVTANRKNKLVGNSADFVIIDDPLAEPYSQDVTSGYAEDLEIKVKDAEDFRKQQEERAQRWMKNNPLK